MLCRCCCSHVGFPKFGPIAIMNRSQGLCALECVQHDAVGSVYTVLTYAVRVGDVSLIKLLIKHGEGIMQSLVFHPSAPPLTSISSSQFSLSITYPRFFFAALDINAAPVVSSPQLSPSSSIDCSRAQPALPFHTFRTLITVLGTAVLWAVALSNVAAFDLLATHPLIDVCSHCLTLSKSYHIQRPFSHANRSTHSQAAPPCM